LTCVNNRQVQEWKKEKVGSYVGMNKQIKDGRNKRRKGGAK